MTRSIAVLGRRRSRRARAGGELQPSAELGERSSVGRSQGDRREITGDREGWRTALVVDAARLEARPRVLGGAARNERDGQLTCGARCAVGANEEAIRPAERVRRRPGRQQRRAAGQARRGGDGGPEAATRRSLGHETTVQRGETLQETRQRRSARRRVAHRWPGRRAARRGRRPA